MLKGSPTDTNAAVIFQGQMNVLQPLFDSGERKLGSENWTQGWDPAIARRSMDQALQLILLGQQTQSAWRPFDKMAGVTAQVVDKLLAGESVDSLTSGTVKMV
jgi:D-xylose transport system substrate-binding protein